METGDETELMKAVSQDPTPPALDRAAISLNLTLALYRREWPRVNEFVEQLENAGGEDNGDFAYAPVPVPAGCYSILLARLLDKELSPAFQQTRDRLSKKSQAAPSNALLLSALAVVDALLKPKPETIPEDQKTPVPLPASTH